MYATICRHAQCAFKLLLLYLSNVLCICLIFSLLFSTTTSSSSNSEPASKQQQVNVINGWLVCLYTSFSTPRVATGPRNCTRISHERAKELRQQICACVRIMCIFFFLHFTHSSFWLSLTLSSSSSPLLLLLYFFYTHTYLFYCLRKSFVRASGYTVAFVYMYLYVFIST